MLSLEYTGNLPTSLVRVEMKDGTVVFEGTVGSGQEFSFIGEDKKGTLGTNISIFINGVKNTDIHTSCSIDIGIGSTFGDFEVTAGSSRNGGNLCPI